MDEMSDADENQVPNPPRLCEAVQTQDTTQTGNISAPTSVLAIVALVLAFIPLLQLIALILAIVALQKINRSSGGIGGRGIAWAGIVVSSVAMFVLVGVVLSVGGSFFVFKKMEQSMQSVIDQTISDANLTYVGGTDENLPEKNGFKSGGVENEDDSGGEIPIVEDGDNIVINPAGSNGTRYLLVEIYLARADEDDWGFRMAIEANSKTLKKTVIDKISILNVQQCSDPTIRPQLILELKRQFQKVLGKDHPIKDVILATWVMQ